MKIKTAFRIFLALSLVLFPYDIIYLQSDFLSSLVPGWNTNITTGRITANLIKFVFLTISTVLYWRLSQIAKSMSLKKFMIHLGFTLTGVLLSKFSLYEILYFNSLTAVDFVNSITIVVVLNILLNILFFTGQILFWRFYIQSKRFSNVKKLT
ncbi:hypothetical protein ACFFLS_09120 [Flavobacterium procerum]|uniref:Uncharacterized protein n=1 Tax=Flavobacterium procerum TaxID=1455569 RepID=A0ABV6BT29_9FLAO